MGNVKITLITFLASLSLIFIINPIQTEAICSFGYYHNPDKSWACEKAGQVTVGNKQTERPTKMVEEMVKTGSAIAIALGSVLIVYSGYLIVTSAGDPRKLERAKLLLITSGAGVSLGLLTFVINHFVQTIAYL